MATINLDADRGLSLIEEKIINLTADIDTMIERKEISDEAAKWLLSEFKNMANICKEYQIRNDEEKGFHTISF